MVQQALAQDVHGVQLCKARDPEAVRRFVQNARYPVHDEGAEELGVGIRGWGSHLFASWVWGLSREAYLEKADVWPLNPEGEIMLGVKIEDPFALENAEKTLAVPGLAFGEHGPRDMGLSYGYLEGRADPPVQVWVGTPVKCQGPSNLGIRSQRAPRFEKGPLDISRLPPAKESFQQLSIPRFPLTEDSCIDRGMFDHPRVVRGHFRTADDDEDLRRTPLEARREEEAPLNIPHVERKPNN